MAVAESSVAMTLKIWVPLAAVAIALAVSNFAWQAMSDQKWDVAFERSYFQAIAVMIAGFNFARDN